MFGGANEKVQNIIQNCCWNAYNHLATLIFYAPGGKIIIDPNLQKDTWY